MRTFRPFAGSASTDANSPDLPFAALQYAVLQLTKAAVHAPRIIPTVGKSAVRTFPTLPAPVLTGRLPRRTNIWRASLIVGLA